MPRENSHAPTVASSYEPVTQIAAVAVSWCLYLQQCCHRRLPPVLHNDSIAIRIINRRIEQCIYDAHGEAVKLSREASVQLLEAFQVRKHRPLGHALAAGETDETSPRNMTIAVL